MPPAFPTEEGKHAGRDPSAAALGTRAAPALQSALVCDAPVRVFHGLMVFCFVGADGIRRAWCAAALPMLVAMLGFRWSQWQAALGAATPGVRQFGDRAAQRADASAQNHHDHD